MHLLPPTNQVLYLDSLWDIVVNSGLRPVSIYVFVRWEGRKLAGRARKSATAEVKNKDK